MKNFLTIILVFSSFLCYGQNTHEEESVDELRTQSGIDPTRTSSRIGYSFLFNDRQGDNAQIYNRFGVTLGIDHWSFNLKTDVV